MPLRGSERLAIVTNGGGPAIMADTLFDRGGKLGWNYLSKLEIS
ncbi:hypothetical protein O9992_28765 [Vibrio lentus]|nr:hypothetical protein [Vibrio lentus]